MVNWQRIVLSISMYSRSNLLNYCTNGFCLSVETPHRELGNKEKDFDLNFFYHVVLYFDEQMFEEISYF